MRRTSRFFTDSQKRSRHAAPNCKQAHHAPRWRRPTPRAWWLLSLAGWIFNSSKGPANLMQGSTTLCLRFPPRRGDLYKAVSNALASSSESLVESWARHTQEIRRLSRRAGLPDFETESKMYAMFQPCSHWGYELSDWVPNGKWA